MRLFKNGSFGLKQLINYLIILIVCSFSISQKTKKILALNKIKRPRIFYDDETKRLENNNVMFKLSLTLHAQ